MMRRGEKRSHSLGYGEYFQQSISIKVAHFIKSVFGFLVSRKKLTIF